MKEEMFDPREAQMTAFALGEMTDEESAAFEKSLTEDPGTLDEIGGIREVAALLQEGFGKELDAMFHPEGLAEPVPTFSVVEFAEEEAEQDELEDKVVALDPFNRFSKPRAAMAGLAAALVAAVAVAPLLRDQSGTGPNLAGAASIPVMNVNLEATELVNNVPLVEFVWNNSTAVDASLRLKMPGTDSFSVPPLAADSPVGFHLASGGPRARSLGYVDPELLRLKESIDALLKNAESSNEAVAMLKGLVNGDGFSEIGTLKAESLYRELQMMTDSVESNSRPARGTVFRYGSRDDATGNNRNGFELGPVWWQTSASDDFGSD